MTTTSSGSWNFVFERNQHFAEEHDRQHFLNKPLQADEPTAQQTMETGSLGTMQSSSAIMSTKEGGNITCASTALPTVTECRKTLDISNLMSPPDPVYDSFISKTTMPPPAVEKQLSRLPEPPLSPPISPFGQPNNNISPTPALSVPVRDPILYPQSDISSSPARPMPLFGPSEGTSSQERVAARDAERDAEKIINNHILATSVSGLSEAERPAREDYRSVLRFKSDVMKRFQADGHAWLRREKALLAIDRATFRGARALPIFSARPATKPQVIRSNANRVQKPTPAKPKESRTTKQQPPRPIRTNAGPARSTIRVSSTPEPRVRTVAPNREDKDYLSLPDYCPPVSSLPKKPNSLKVDWKGNPLDLSKDPHAYLLHPDELSLAAGLRLDCATYLTSKRRIFIRRLECAKIGKEFRKTDAQQACKIDVNKASKLWTAYENVGWLDARWMARLLS